MTYSHGFFFVPPRAPCRAFKNHVIKSTASPAEQKTIDQHHKLVSMGEHAVGTQDIYRTDKLSA